MNCKFLKKSVFLISLAFIHTTAESEEIKLTSYYPSPSGKYQSLRTTDQTILASNTTSSVGIGQAASASFPNSMAILDIYSANKGLLLPRLTEAQKPAASTSNEGLLLFNTDAAKNRAEFSDGAIWTSAVGSSPADDNWGIVNTTDLYNKNTGNVGIHSVKIYSSSFGSPPVTKAKLHLFNCSLIVTGTTGGIPVLDAGRRFMWVPSRAALRAGEVDGAQWNTLGYGSFAAGFNPMATGDYSTALGRNSSATASTAVAMGQDAAANGTESVAIGLQVTASGNPSYAIGSYVSATADSSFVIGQGVDNSDRLVNNISQSLMIGFNSTIPTLFIKNQSVGIGTTNPSGALDVNGPIYQRGSQRSADYVFKSNYPLESIREHAAYMWKHHHLKAVGPAKKDANDKEIVEIGTLSKGLLEELEKLHIYIEQLNRRLKELEAKTNEKKYL